MIRYFLSIKCSTEGCINNENASSFWYDNPTTSHPCGVCGIMITDCEVLDEKEFASPPPPPALPIVEEAVETQEEAVETQEDAVETQEDAVETQEQS